MLVHSVRRGPPPTASSCHRISKPPHLYSSALGASARVTVVSVTYGVGAPTVVSFTVVPTVPRFPSASKGAHSRSSYLLQRCCGEEVEFVTVMLWESLKALRAFAGPDYDQAIVPVERRKFLLHYEER